MPNDTLNDNYFSNYEYDSALSAPRIKNDIEAQDWNPSLSGNIDFIIPFDGIAKDIQQWILDGQRRKQPGLSLCSTLAILSTAKGRIQNYEGSIKGNFMMIGLCESGDGKEYCLRVVEKALSQCKNEKTNLGNLVQGQMASGAALIDAINEHGHTCAMVVDEIGHYLGGVSGKKANVYAAEIMPLMTELYTKSDGLFIGKSKKGEPGARILEPNLTLLGMSSEKQFLETLTEGMISDGSLARFFIVFGETDPPPIFDSKSEPLPKHIAETLLDVYQMNIALYAGDFESNKLSVTDDYRSEFKWLQEIFYAKALGCNGDKQKEVFKPFYKRLAVKSLQMALLIDDCQSVEVLQWCAEICEKTLDIFIKKYNHNVAGSIYEVWNKTVEKAIKESGKKGISKNDLRVKTRAMPVDSRDKIINDLIKHEQVFTTNEEIHGKINTLYFWRK